MEYNFSEIERRWQKIWAEKKTFKASDKSEKPKYYVLDMFPYPSGAGLHVGHPLGYIASDIVSRYKRHKGFNVLHPMGYDAFGLPAEQYAIQTGQHPAITTEQNIKRYRQQLDKIGFSFDWDREVCTTDPKYYKWTQWIFIQLFNSWYNNASNKAEKIDTLIAEFQKSGNANVNAAQDTVELFSASEWNSFTEEKQREVLMCYRLAFLSEAFVNWCPALGTVLANDEVKDGVSERGGYPVERKMMKQWSMRITAYADRLLKDLDALDWSESIKESQRNWIGKSEGTSLKFKACLPDRQVESLKFEVEVFTTRPDTIFGVSFVTLAPEHELVSQITTAEQKKQVDEYVVWAKNRSERERQADVKKITGVFTGAYVKHPFTNKDIPIWVGDYVLAGYGTGAVMAVPAHDTRDFAFAKHFNLPLPVVISPVGGDTEGGGSEPTEAYDAKEGKIINSDFLNGLDVKAAIKKAIEAIEKKGIGKGKTNFRLRDAVFGRQRYWGEPIPVYYKNGIPYTVEEKHLPLELPEVDKFLPTETGEPPLARAKEWTYSPLHGRGVGGEALETTTMPGWAGSSWYFLRYMDANNPNAFASKEAVNYWKEVDLYIGGSEHATGHLLYVRFWTKFLFDLGLIPVNEPAKKLINQGMIQGVSEKIFKFGSKSDSTGLASLFLIDPMYSTNEIKKISDRSFINIPTSEIVFISYDLIKKSKFQYLNINVDISLVDSRSSMDALCGLDIEMYREKVTENATAIFLCSGGIWHLGKFYSLNNGGSDKFYTCPEVEKMSKSKWNVVTPDVVIDQYGADTLRLYEMFLGPLEQSKPWSTQGISGVSGFLKRLWRLFYMPEWNNSPLLWRGAGGEAISNDEPTKAELKALHKCIKKVSDDIDRFSFNTSVSNFMICVNELTELKCNKRAILEPLLVLLSPYAPHIAEELWNKLGHAETIEFAAWPEFNEAHLVDNSFAYPVSFNGKMRFKLELPLALQPPEIEKEVMSNEEAIKYLEGKTPKKVIIVHNKIVNIVL